MRRTWIVALAILCTAQPLAAQETITLDTAITRALQHSARLAELEARRSGAEAAESGAAAARQPIVSLVGGYTRTNHVDEFGIALPGQPLRLIYPDVPDNVRSRLDLQWPIYTGGATQALERAAGAEKQALGHDLEAARADLRLDVTRAFWAAATAREAERVLERALQRMDVQLRDLKARLEQGLIPPNDVTAAEAQRSRQQLLAIEARNNRLVADADLQRLVGSPTPLVPAEPLAASAPTQVAELLGPTPALRPEHRAQEQRVEAAKARESAVAAAARPSVAAVAGFDYARPNPRIFPRAARWEDSWDVGVNVSWTLWDGGRRGAQQAEAASATRAAEARRLELERLIGFELQQRSFEVDSSRAAIGAAAEAVRSAAETLRVVNERYKAGVATSTEILDAEVALLQAELERTRAHASERLAIARLERAAGRK